MYHTPNGDRVLTGDERCLFTHALAVLVDMLADGDMAFDIATFDELQRTQQLFVLHQAARALLSADEPVPVLTAALESAVAVVYTQAIFCLISEVDSPPESGDRCFWRKLVLAAATEQDVDMNLPDANDPNLDNWILLVESIADRVLWDADYEIREGLDLAPEKSEELRKTLGMTEDYLTHIPYDPPDDQVDLYLDALRDLTADVR